MAFPGTELEEVAPTTVGTTCAGGGKVFAIAAGTYGASGYAAVMDTATGESVLYAIPTHCGDGHFPASHPLLRSASM